MSFRGSGRAGLSTFRLRSGREETASVVKMSGAGVDAIAVNTAKYTNGSCAYVSYLCFGGQIFALMSQSSNYWQESK